MNPRTQTPHPRREHHVAATLDAPAVSRRLVERWIGNSSRREHAVLAVSELVSNALIHGPEPQTGDDITIRLMQDERGTRRVTVSRRGPAFDPSVSVRTPHGLALVDAVADRWGVEHSDGNMAVWFEIGGDTAEGPSSR